MNERMDAIWKKVYEKQTLEEAAYQLCIRRGERWKLKLSIFTACGVIITLLPVAGAAQAYACLL